MRGLNNVFIMEIDVDGVIADIHNGLNSYVSKKFGIDFSGERDIHTWGMKELDPDVRKYVLQLFNSPEFIGNLKYLDCSLEALILIDIMLRKLGGKIVLNTNINSACKEAREDWLKTLIKTSGIKAECITDSNPVKNMLKDSYIVVEDNAENLRNSNAPYKFLIRRGHNRSVTVEDLIVDNCNSKIYIVDDLWCVFGVLEKELNLTY